MTKAELTIVADENIPALEDCFGDLGTLVRLPGRDMTREQLRDADILLVRSVTRVNEALLAGTPVRFVGSCTIGTDHLDTGWLERQGIHWSAAPGCNANSVVEYVFSALAALNHDWNGRRFGIVGCGNVGGLLQKRLRALDIPCAVYDPWLPDNPDAADLDRVLQQDVICLHAPLVKGGPHPSLHMLGAEQLARIKDGAVLISAGRGAVVDNRALLELLRRGRQFTTVLDVWENEPDIDTELLELVDIGTPHIAGYSLDGKLAGTRMIREALDKSGLGVAVGAVGRPSAGGRDQCQLPWRDLSRPPAAPGRAAPTGVSSGFAAMAALLLQIYDPRKDDQRLRVAAEGELPMARAFDQLRRDYPERLEFSHYRIDGAVLTELQRSQLKILGLE
ncbi:4-phosphoerythronate dehydrogenase [Microbulbifer taiwanensis]|uniref:Erythronate-4-phosphate dehydrogenase n=1 Tax=Microbulbifer taiwanensis TaxID=986746 RepID=A0ABW1YR53_9GAMM